jgi:hypothetical protein
VVEVSMVGISAEKVNIRTKAIVVVILDLFLSISFFSPLFYSFVLQFYLIQ